MIFKVDHVDADTCGNSWAVGEPEYREAKSLADVWEKMGKPMITAYWLTKDADDDGFVSPFTNVMVKDGMGFCHQGRNPKFNWNKDKSRAYGFESKGKKCWFFRVNPVFVKK